MKKSFVSIVAIAATMLSVSCQKEQGGNGDGNDVKSYFSAYVDGAGPESKTFLDGNMSKWSGVERIWLLNGEGAWKKAYTTENITTPSLSAMFCEESADSQLTGDAFYALYPAEPANDASWTAGESKIANLYLKPEQDAVAGGYDPASHIAVAHAASGNNSLMFKNVVSYFKFTLASDNVSEVCIFGNSGEMIAGNFGLDYNAGEPVAASEGNVQAAYAKVLPAAPATTLEKGKSYYMAVLPAVFSAGFSVEMVADGLKSTVRTTEKSYELKRNKIVDLGEIEYVAPQTQTIYLYPGIWATSSAVLSAYYWNDSIGLSGWADFSDADGDGRYEAAIPISATKCHYIRSNPSKPHDWDKNVLWNRYDDVNLAQYNCLTVNGWDSFELSKID